MKCTDAENYIVELIYDELDESVKDDLLEHLKTCDSCSDAYVDLKKGTVLLTECFETMDKQVLTEDEMTAILAVEAPAEAAQPRKENAPRRVLPFFFGRSWGMAATAMIFCGVLALFVISKTLQNMKSPEATAMAEQATNAPSKQRTGRYKEMERLEKKSEARFDYKPGASEGPRGGDYIEYEVAEEVTEEIPGVPGRDRRQRDGKKDKSSLTVDYGKLRSEVASGTNMQVQVDGIDPGKALFTIVSPSDVSDDVLSFTDADEVKKPSVTVPFETRDELDKLKRKNSESERKDEINEEVFEDVKSNKKLTQQGQALEKEASQADPDRESVFKAVKVNPFVMTSKDCLSTFALDTDTASFTIARKYVSQGYLPPVSSVRTEEYVNAFDYNYPGKAGNVFTVHAEAAPSPFGKGLVLLKVGVRGKVIGRDGRKPSHLVFAVDTSGSMDRRDRMPLLKKGLESLLEKLDPNDRVSLVTYGRDSRLVLDNESANNKDGIRKAIDALRCGGSTNLDKGIAMAYNVAKNNFRSGGVNSIILCSDGMANVGAQDADSLVKTAETYRKQGIAFNSVGFGMGNYNDDVLETMANKGDGSYVFIDTEKAAISFFSTELGNRLNVIAKDAKIQVKFDPAKVRRYRLLGYENRDIKDKDFRNDSVDAGEVGSGQSATALYEVELIDGNDELARKDLGTVFVRYKNTETEAVEEINSRIRADVVRDKNVSDNPRFFLAAAVAEYAEIMRQSDYAKDGSLEDVERLAAEVAMQLRLDDKVKDFLNVVRSSKGLPRGR